MDYRESQMGMAAESAMKAQQSQIGGMGTALLPRQTVTSSVEESISAMNELNVRLSSIRDHLQGPRPETSNKEASRPDGSLSDRTQTLKGSILAALQKIGEIESAL